MNAANLFNSDRLMKMYEALRDHGPITTFDLMKRTKSCSVATDISELRGNGYDITCEYVGTRNGRKIYRYKLEG